MNDAMLLAQARLRQQPDDALAWAEYGELLSQSGQLLRALNALQQAVALNPDSVFLVRSLANQWSQQGQTAEAEHLLRVFVDRVHSLSAHSDLIRLMPRLPGCDVPKLLAEDARWQLLATERLAVPPVGGERAAGRIRVAYFSSDLTAMGFGRFLIANLTYQDRAVFELTVLHDGIASDDVTRRLQSLADHWVETGQLSDDGFASVLQEHCFDMLVDLDGHGGQRGAVFAQKGRMLVLSWLGMPAFASANLLIGDANVYPAELAKFYKARHAMLPFGSHCWIPPENAPSFSSLPLNAGKGPVLGCMGCVSSLHDGLIGVWKGILEKLPSARLRLLDPVLVDPGVQAQIQQRLADAGIAPERLELIGLAPETDRLAEFQHIDVMLDTFPFSQRASCCEALWMGVPVITLRGSLPWQNVATSLVCAAGFPDLSVQEEAQFVQKVVDVACDTFQRQVWRWTMRTLMMHSPLCAGVLFVSHFQLQLQQYWQHYQSLPTLGD